MKLYMRRITEVIPSEIISLVCREISPSPLHIHTSMLPTKISCSMSFATRTFTKHSFKSYSRKTKTYFRLCKFLNDSKNGCNSCGVLDSAVVRYSSTSSFGALGLSTAMAAAIVLKSCDLCLANERKEGKCQGWYGTADLRKLVQRRRAGERVRVFMPVS